ncbi:Acyl-CoA synthetase (AMP-forming)/AMP-acid ligase II [Cellulosimicrobium aquatile]|uniref:Acyl-CoA synthetase (AMP-forming)/AMP-acid ligase II n=1 Tax=Cellulosimicrobium aquatile TaxID=1612203 RepID=A0A1N6U1G5_9MICO|nr:class I adenylate-forming enzyme family protein [Cellulosimicrobium aquatile]SIQ59462.1 Acyl-CoA synthetase (AMP-forming)/AMP-acid ligase II [Cellulosimicrobium aquatile]
MTAPDDVARHLLAPILARGAAGHASADAVALRRWTRPGRRGARVREEASYADLARRVEATATTLSADGLAPGDRALFSVRPRPEGVVLAFGVVRAGGTVVFVDPGSTPELFAARVSAAGPSLATTESLLYAVSRGPLRRLARSRGLLLPDYASLPLRHVHAGPWLPGVPRGSRAARRLAASAVDRAALPPLDPDREALTVFTSGTTAQPKAVVHTAGSLLAGCDLLRDVFALAPGDVVHTDQMLLGVPALLAGATWSVPADPPSRDITTFARQLDGAAGTYLVPADVTALLDVIEAGAVPARGPRVALVGGAPVTRALLERAARLLPGTRWVAVYGMTEILPVAVVEAREKLAYAGDGDLVGVPLPGTVARLDPVEDEEPEGGRDAVGEPGRDDVVGELVLSGPSLMAGYLHDLDAPARGAGARAAEHRTGDLARRDDAGRLVLVGRTRDMIIRGTTNIYPGLYEPRVAALDGVGEALLVGVPQVDGDERVALVVTSASGDSRPDTATRPDPRPDAGTAVRLDPHHPLVDRVRTALPGMLDHDALPDVVLLADRIPLAGRSRKPDRAALSRAAAPLVPAAPLETAAPSVPAAPLVPAESAAVGRDTPGARA